MIKVCSRLTVASIASCADVEKEVGGGGARMPSMRSQEKEKKNIRLGVVENWGVNRHERRGKKIEEENRAGRIPGVVCCRGR